MRGWGVVLLIGVLMAGLWLMFGARLASGLDSEDLMRLAYLAILGSFVGAGLFSGGWQKMRADLRALMFWAVALIAVSGAYALRHDLQAFGQRVVGALVPGTVMESKGEVTVTRGRNGMFEITGEVNGANVRFIFDTGASGLSLTAEDAKRAGLSPGESDFTVNTMTANGVAKVAPVIIERFAVGSIVFNRLSATVSRPGALTRSLLGHEFLDRLASYEVRGDQLILRRK